MYVFSGEKKLRVSSYVSDLGLYEPSDQFSLSNLLHTVFDTFNAVLFTHIFLQDTHMFLQDVFVLAGVKLWRHSKKKSIKAYLLLYTSLFTTV